MDKQLQNYLVEELTGCVKGIKALLQHSEDLIYVKSYIERLDMLVFKLKGLNND